MSIRKAVDPSAAKEAEHLQPGSTRAVIQPQPPRRQQVGRAMPTLPAFARCRRKFRRYFPAGFRDADYLAWERDYKWQAHVQWQKALPGPVFRRLLNGDPLEIARRAVRIESRTNLLFSFEKMALRDAVRGRPGAARFARALYELLHGGGHLEQRFDDWCEALAKLPRRQTRVLTWPLATVFGFIAQPRQHIFLKPMVTRRAAARCGCAFHYVSRPGGGPYAAYLKFARAVRSDLADLKPRDLIDIQSSLGPGLGRISLMATSCLTHRS
jgi:hypothetical protein